MRSHAPLHMRSTAWFRGTGALDVTRHQSRFKHRRNTIIPFARKWFKNNN